MPTKTYRSPVWKYAHPVKYLKSEARKARRAMAPTKALGRVFSVPEIRAALGTRTTKVTAETRQKQVAGVQRKETAAKKKATRVIKPRPAANGGNANYRRKKNGQFNGREAMSPHERALFDRAQQQRVDPQLLPRSARTRKRPAGY